MKKAQTEVVNNARRPDQPDWDRDGNTNEIRDGLHTGKTESSEVADSSKLSPLNVGACEFVPRRSRGPACTSEDRENDKSHEHGSTDRSSLDVEHKTGSESNIQNKEQIDSRKTCEKQETTGKAGRSPNEEGSFKTTETNEKQINQQISCQDSPKTEVGLQPWKDAKPRRPEKPPAPLITRTPIKLENTDFHAKFHDVCTINLGSSTFMSQAMKKIIIAFLNSMEYGLHYVYTTHHYEPIDLCEILGKISKCSGGRDVPLLVMELIKHKLYNDFLNKWYEILVPNVADIPKAYLVSNHQYDPRIDLLIHLRFCVDFLSSQMADLRDFTNISREIKHLVYPDYVVFPDSDVTEVSSDSEPEYEIVGDAGGLFPPLDKSSDDDEIPPPPPLDLSDEEEEVNEPKRIERPRENNIDPDTLNFDYRPVRKVLINDPEGPIFTPKAMRQSILEFESEDGYVTLAKHEFGDQDERLDPERKNYSNKVYYEILYKFNVEESESGERLVDHRRLACNQLLLSTLVRNWYVRGWDATRACLSGLHTPAYYMPCDSYATLTSPEMLMVIKIIAESDKVSDEQTLEWVPGCDSKFVPKDPRAELAMSRIFPRDCYELTVRAVLLMATTARAPDIYSLNQHNLKEAMAKRTFNRFNHEAYNAHKDYFWQWVNNQDFLQGDLFVVERTDFEEYTIDMCKRKRLTVNQTKQLVIIARAIRTLFERDYTLLYRVFISYMYDKTNVFIKDEFYPKDSTLRFIISPDAVVKIILGTVFRKIEEWLYFNERSFLKKCNVKRLTYQQIDAKIMKESRGCNVFLATDYSGYESSQGVECQRMKFAVYKKFYSSDGFGGHILDLYFKYSCSPKKVYNKNFWMIVYSQQMSGFPDTACGNLLLNWINVTFFMLLHPVMMLLEGDDGELGFERKEDVDVQEAIAHSLFPIDEFEFKENPFELSFCGHLQTPDGTPIIADPEYFEQKMCYMFTNANQISYRKKYELMYLRILSAQLLYPRDPHVASLWSCFVATFKTHYEVRYKTYEQFCRNHWWQLENGRFLFDFDVIPKEPMPVHELLPNDFLVGDPDTNNEFLRTVCYSSTHEPTSGTLKWLMNCVRFILIKLLTGVDWIPLLLCWCIEIVTVWKSPSYMKLIFGCLAILIRISTSRFYPRSITLWLETRNWLYGLLSTKRTADKVRSRHGGRTHMSGGMAVLDRLTVIPDENHYTPYDIMAAYRWRPKAGNVVKKVKRFFLGDVKYLADSMSSRAFAKLCVAYYETDPEFM